MAVMISFRALSVAEVTSSETRLHSEEGMVGFEIVGDLFVNLAFEDLVCNSLGLECLPL